MEINKGKILAFLKGRKILILSLVFLLAASPLLYSSLRSGKRAEAAWWDETWLYRKAIQVTNNTSTQSNVYISLTINTSDTSKFQSDCGDLRFTKQNGELLDYYIVSGCGTSSTLIHVNFDIFPTGSQTIYYYYGNPSAPNGFSTSDFPIEASNYTIGSTSSEEQSRGPVAYWKFDEGTGTTTYDSTANKNNGTISGATWQTEDLCVVGKCLYFDGSGDTVEIADNGTSTLDFTSQFTFSAWVKPYDICSSTECWFANKENTYEFGLKNGTIQWAINNTSPGWNFVNTNKTIPTNQWSFVTFTYKASSNTFITYINGVQVHSYSATGNLTPNNNALRIGARGAPGQIKAVFKGFIDEVKLYPYARTAAQVLADYNAGKAKAASSKGAAVNLGAPKDASAGLPSSLSEGLVGYWKMDESSSPAVDSSGNGNNGTWIGTADDDSGKFGNAISLDGNSGYIEIGSTAPVNESAGTYSVWIYPETVGERRHIIYAGENGDGWGSHNELHLSLENNNTVGLYHYNGSGYNIQLSTSLATINQWYYLTATWDGNTSTANLYINGELKATDSSVTAVSKTGWLNKIRIGVSNNPNGRYFDGKIDEVRIYNRALSPAEVRALYEWAPGPKVYLKADEGQGTTAFDFSGNSNNGSITGGLWKIGKFGKGIWLDGTDDYVSVGDFGY